jgi:hypothetical protein
VVRPAPLPRCAGQRRADGLDQATVRVRCHQRHPGQAACGQVAEERQPPGTVLGRGDVQAEDLSVAIGIDADREQRVDVARPAALTHLEHQGISGQERVRAGVQRPGAERLDLFVGILGHHRYLRLGQPRDAECLDQFLHPPRADTEQVAGRDHTHQCCLGAAPAFEQPVRTVGPLAQLRDRQLDRAGSGVPLPAPAAVADVGPFTSALGSAARIGDN